MGGKSWVVSAVLCSSLLLACSGEGGGEGVAAPAPAPPARVIPIARYLRPASQYKLPLQAASEGEESQ